MDNCMNQRLSGLGQKIDECIDNGLLKGASVAVIRKNTLVYESFHGEQSPNIPITKCSDTIYRIFSMTKPIVSVGLMQLYEKEKFKLTDPLKKYIPSFDKSKMKGIYDAKQNKMKRILNDIQIWHLLTHTAGISYGFDVDKEPVDKLFYHSFDEKTNQQINIRAKTKEMKLCEFIDNELCKMPLVFEPGTKYHYSLATDICGRLIEILSGISLDEYLYKNIFKPLNMTDTSFYIPHHKQYRFATLYAPQSPNNITPLIEVEAKDCRNEYNPKKIRYFSGGGGLVSTLNDYVKFGMMLLNKGYCINTHKHILSRKTVEFMTKNHLPNGSDTASLSHQTNGGMYQQHVAIKGAGFGLGFSVITDNTVSNGTANMVSSGSYGWYGYANTHFWIDPKEELLCVFMTQLQTLDKTQFDVRDILYRFVYSSMVNSNHNQNNIKSKL